MFIAFKMSAARTRRQLRKNSTKLSDPKLLQLNDQLARAAGITNVSVMVHDVDAINGLATPEGDIYLTRGLLNCHRRQELSAEEVCSVTAHELGHVALGHAKKRLATLAIQNAIRSVFGVALGRLVPLPGGRFAIGWLADLLVRLLLAGFSRADELQADKYATALMIKSGLGTEPQKNLLRKLEELSGRPATGVAWLISHPSISKRIEAIELNEHRWRLEGK